ncbi:MAG: B12-binding domain-containing radical SAM protein [Sphingomonadaceae bacterium]|nr:B12-binding domain-containing radical SAM protein [Sphingomonadaceae bacterium]
MRLPKTRVLLISPRFNDNSFWSFKATCKLQGAKALAPPLGLITLAALLPRHWDVRLLDHNVVPLGDADLAEVDLVMTGGMLPQEPDIRAIMERCRRLGIPVCLGGPAPTSTPELYDEADFIVVGEAEGVIGEFVALWEAGERRGRITAEKFTADVTTTPIPRFELLNFRDYLWINVQFSRGCPFTCEFCDIIELYGRAPRTKTAPQMLAELDRLFALGYRGQLDFVDDNLIGNKKAVKVFLPELAAWQKAHGYPFFLTTEASLNLSDDDELLGMMRRANFSSVFVGIETPDEATLVHTAKKQNTRRSIAESVHRIYGAGIYVSAGFIVGFDTETGGMAGSMAGCIRDTSIPIATIGLLTALPNTQLSRRLRKEGRLFDHYRQSMTQSGDMGSAGLNFVTLRPRREVLLDFREVVATAYAPEAYFGRVRAMSRMLRPPMYRLEAILRGNIFRDARTVLRLAWMMTVRHPELARHFWGTLRDVLKHNPKAIDAALRTIAVFAHLYAFSRYLVEMVDNRLAAMDRGEWQEPQPFAPEPLLEVA